MSVKINIISGFLGSGKTNFINSILNRYNSTDESIIIIENEIGETEINSDSSNIKVINYCEEIDNKFIKEILINYSPDRILIELNSFKDPSSIIKIFNDKPLKKSCRIADIITIINAQKFQLYFNNMKNIITSQIFNSEKIILNNLDNLNHEDYLKLIEDLRQINEKAEIIKYLPSANMDDSNDEECYELDASSNASGFNPILILFAAILLFIGFTALSFSNVQYSAQTARFYTIFTSILIEGLPFILIGSFISSLIQVSVSQSILTRLFHKNIFISCITAAFSGFLFPICDCGIIPVVKGLLKKDVPLCACITFMLAAPIINPISIASTIYAFQGMKSVVICRISAGIIIAVLVGLAMHFFTKNEEDILIDNSSSTDCSCGFCNNTYDSSDNKLSKIKAVFLHTGDEFFNIGKFMIMGTFMSSLFQTMISINNNMFIPNDNRSSLILMILLSFILSVCSTSDAFIAKGFLKYFSINSVMGFLVAGPMIDLKNTIMLFGNFKKAFVLKLIFFIFIISFGVLINLNLA